MCHFRSGRLFILLYESGFFPTQVALILDRSFIFSSLVARRVVYLIRSSIEELRVHRSQVEARFEALIDGVPMVFVDSRYTPVRFDLICISM